jgi:amino acid permease
MYSKKQRIAALCGIILLVALYLFTLIAAIFQFDATGNLLKACLFATIAVPILIWVYIWMYGVWTQKHTPASFDFMQDMKENKDESEDKQSNNPLS